MEYALQNSLMKNLVLIVSCVCLLAACAKRKPVAPEGPKSGVEPSALTGDGKTGSDSDEGGVVDISGGDLPENIYEIFEDMVRNDLKGMMRIALHRIDILYHSKKREKDYNQQVELADGSKVSLFEELFRKPESLLETLDRVEFVPQKERCHSDDDEDGKLEEETSCYNSKTNQIAIGFEDFKNQLKDSLRIALVGVACHEFGHARGFAKDDRLANAFRDWCLENPEALLAEPSVFRRMKIQIFEFTSLHQQALSNIRAEAMRNNIQSVLPRLCGWADTSLVKAELFEENYEAYWSKRDSALFDEWDYQRPEVRLPESFWWPFNVKVLSNLKEIVGECNVLIKGDDLYSQIPPDIFYLQREISSAPFNRITLAMNMLNRAGPVMANMLSDFEGPDKGKPYKMPSWDAHGFLFGWILFENWDKIYPLEKPLPKGQRMYRTYSKHVRCSVTGDGINSQVNSKNLILDLDTVENSLSQAHFSFDSSLYAGYAYIAVEHKLKKNEKYEDSSLVLESEPEKLYTETPNMPMQFSVDFIHSRDTHRGEIVGESIIGVVHKIHKPEIETDFVVFDPDSGYRKELKLKCGYDFAAEQAEMDSR